MILLAESTVAGGIQVVEAPRIVESMLDKRISSLTAIYTVGQVTQRLLMLFKLGDTFLIWYI